MRAVILAIAGWLVVLSLAAHAASENYQGAIPYPSVGGNTSRTPATRANDHGINIKEFGAIGDGSSHPLSGIYGTLAAAQAVYPFVDDLTMEVDWAATQAAIDYAYSSGQQVTYCPGVTAPNASYQLSLPIFVDKPGNFRGSNPKWVIGTTYANNAAVTWNGVPWTSLGAGNVGQAPTLGLNGGDPTMGNVQISNASPAVVSWPGVPLTPGSAIVLNASSSDGTASDPVVAGTLPTGISANTVYYILSAGYVASTSFEISATPGGSPINTSSTYTGSITSSNQVWTVTPVIGSSFSDTSTFIGQEGLSSAVGCSFYPQFGNGTAFYLGPNNGNLIKSVSLYHNNYTVSFPRCGWTASSVGFGELGNGGGASRTKLENVGADGFFTDFETGDYSTGALDDSNTVVKASLGNACNSVWIKDTQNFINGFYDSNLGGVTSIQSTVGGGANMWGGNASFIGDHTAFAISSVSSPSGTANDVFMQATITSPDQYLTNIYCVMSLLCHYTTWSIQTAHFGILSMNIISFNPATNVAVFEVFPDWLGTYGNTCCGGIGTDIAAATKVYADESSTTFNGIGISVRGVHVENPGNANRLLYAYFGFGGYRPDRLTDIFGNADATNASYVCCYQNPSEVPTDGVVASFYATQNLPFIETSGGVPIIIDGMSGFNGSSSSDNLLFDYSSPGATLIPLTVRNSVIPHFNFLGSGGGLDPPFSGGIGENGYQSSCSAGLGCGDFDNPSNSTAGSGHTTYADIWKMARGSSPMTGVHPSYGTAAPCLTAAQVTTLGSLPAITFTSSLNFSRAITGGGAGSSAGYTAAGVLTLVGGTFSQAAQITVDTVDGGGGILTWHVTRGGTYTVEPTSFTVTGGTGTGAAFNTAGWYVAYAVSYPMLYGGTQYRLCDWNLGSQSHYGLTSTHFAWSFGQNLTTSNVPNIAWTSTNGSPVVYMNNEVLQLLYPGINMTLTATGGTSGCASQSNSLMITEVHATAGYVKVLNSAQDGTPFLPSWAGTCTGTTIGQASYALVNLN